MSKLGLLQAYGPCECDVPDIEIIEHAEVEYDRHGRPCGSHTVEDAKCKSCGGVAFLETR